MPNRKPKYSDMERYTQTRNEQRKRYYQQTAFQGRHPWTPEEDKMILEHKITDSQLSDRIGHSVASIQKRRSELKKGTK